MLPIIDFVNYGYVWHWHAAQMILWARLKKLSNHSSIIQTRTFLGMCMCTLTTTQKHMLKQTNKNMKYPLNQIWKVHHFVFFLPDVGDHNFCRNPDGSEKPWCYVSGSDGATRKEACDIRTCQGSHVHSYLKYKKITAARMHINVHFLKKTWQTFFIK